MPFEIVRNDIVNMQVDAIVNSANPKPIIGHGVDKGIHKKAGPRLLEERKKIGNINVGEASITPGYLLDAKFVIHTVGPVWIDGTLHEEKLLRQCYERSLELAFQNKCESIAFPLIATGNYGFPKTLALQTAINVFSKFLMNHEMQIYLVVFSKDAYSLSEKLFQTIESYIDEKYIKDKMIDEYEIDGSFNGALMEYRVLRELEDERRSRMMDMYQINSTLDEFPKETLEPSSLEELLEHTDAGFSETLLKLIDSTGKKDSDIYKKANIDRKLFSKIRNNKDYRPSKTTTIAFAIALELDLEETKDFIARAGYALTHSSKFDIIIEYFITHRIYDIFEINKTLFAFDQSLLGS